MDGTPTTAIGVLEVPQPHARSTSRFYTRVRTCDGFCASTLYLKCGPSYLYNLYIIPIHSMYGIYPYIDPPGTTPTDPHIWQSHGSRLGSYLIYAAGDQEFLKARLPKADSGIGLMIGTMYNP